MNRPPKTRERRHKKNPGRQLGGSCRFRSASSYLQVSPSWFGATDPLREGDPPLGGLLPRQEEARMKLRLLYWLAVSVFAGGVAYLMMSGRLSWVWSAGHARGPVIEYSSQLDLGRR